MTIGEPPRSTTDEVPQHPPSPVPAPVATPRVDVPQSQNFRVKETSVYGFDQGRGTWVESVVPRATTPPPVRSVRVATFNVLSDHSWAVRVASASRKRYDALPGELQWLDADVLALHDVGPAALRALLASDFIRGMYRVTDIAPPRRGNPISVLLTKLPVARSYSVAVGGFVFPAVVAEVPSTTAPGTSIPFVFGAFHATGRSGADDAIRRHVLASAFTHALRSLQPPEFENDIAVLGDVGQKHDSEDVITLAADLLDCWAETHFAEGDDQAPGFTLDPVLNPMLRHVAPGDRRRLRPDHILVGAGGRLSPCGAAFLFGTSALPPQSEQERHSRLSRLGVPLRTVDVMLSDHFGVAVDMKAGRPFVGDDTVRAVLDENAHRAVPLSRQPVSELIEKAFDWVEHTAWFCARLTHLG